jgi:hypothetical protein
MYSIRVATEQEENRISTALKLFNHCKTVYQSIIDDANQYYNGDVNRFIDDEAYYVVNELHKDLDTVNKLTEGLMTFATGNYCFYLY